MSFVFVGQTSRWELRNINTSLQRVYAQGRTGVFLYQLFDLQTKCYCPFQNNQSTKLSFFPSVDIGLCFLMRSGVTPYLNVHRPLNAPMTLKWRKSNYVSKSYHPSHNWSLKGTGHSTPQTKNSSPKLKPWRMQDWAAKGTEWINTVSMLMHFFRLIRNIPKFTQCTTHTGYPNKRLPFEFKHQCRMHVRIWTLQLPNEPKNA